jgi:hypothetical protein
MSSEKYAMMLDGHSCVIAITSLLILRNGGLHKGTNTVPSKAVALTITLTASAYKNTRIDLYPGTTSQRCTVGHFCRQVGLRIRSIRLLKTSRALSGGCGFAGPALRRDAVVRGCGQPIQHLISVRHRSAICVRRRQSLQVSVGVVGVVQRALGRGLGEQAIRSQQAFSDRSSSRDSRGPESHISK